MDENEVESNLQYEDDYEDDTEDSEEESSGSNVEYVDDITDNPDTDDTLNDILSESDREPEPESADDTEMNKEGVTGDEWYDEYVKDVARDYLKMEAEEQEAALKEEQAQAQQIKSQKEQNRENAERRIREKQERQENNIVSDDDLDSAEVNDLREYTSAIEQRLNVATPVMDYLVKNQINQEALQLGVEFVNSWKRDKVNTAKMLLTALEKEGINVGDILEHESTQSRVDAEVNRRLQPYQQQEMQMRQQAEAKNILDGFLAKHPDAWEHLNEITEVMRRTNSRNPHDAYYRLRRVYKDNNTSWFGQEQQQQQFEESEVPQNSYAPSVASSNINDFDMDFEEPNSMRDIVKNEARKYFRR